MASARKIKYWLKSLPEPYRSKAIKNYCPDNKYESFTSQKQALLSAFLWEKTKEGFEYWNELFLKIN